TRQIEALAGGQRRQVLIGRAVVLHHAGAELLDLVILRVLLRQLAELDLGDAADRGLLDEILVLLAELLSGVDHGLPLGDGGAGEQQGDGGGRKQKAAGHCVSRRWEWGCYEKRTAPAEV